MERIKCEIREAGAGRPWDARAARRGDPAPARRGGRPPGAVSHRRRGEPARPRRRLRRAVRRRAGRVRRCRDGRGCLCACAASASTRGSRRAASPTSCSTGSRGWPSSAGSPASWRSSLSRTRRRCTSTGGTASVGRADDAEMLALEKRAARDRGLRAPVRVSLIAVPYDLGRADVGSGRGPERVPQGRGRGGAARPRPRGRGGHRAPRDAVHRRAAGGPRRDKRARGRRGARALRRLAPARRGRQLQRDARRARRAAARRRRRRRAGVARRPRRLQHARHHGDRLPRRHAARHAVRARVPRGGGAWLAAERARRRRSVLHAGGRDFDRKEHDSCSLASGVRVVDGGELRDRGPAEALAPALDALAASAPRRHAAWSRTTAAGAPARRSRRARPGGRARASRSPRRTASLRPSCWRPSTSCASGSRSSPSR